MNVGILIICIIALSLVTLIPQAIACSCAADWRIEDDFAAIDNVIFSGKVTNIKEQQRTFLVTFEINQSWKGMPNNVSSINIMTFESSSSCGYNFVEQQSYLVVAHGKWDQTPEVSSCGSTTVLAFADEQISFLNKNTQNKYEVSETFYENEMLILLENYVRKVYYTGENIISVKADPKTASVIFEASKNAKLDVKAPKVYKVGPDLFVLRNGEEVDAVRHSNECFFYATIETQQPETIEIIFAFWPEYMEAVEDCEIFTVTPLKQVKLGIGGSDIVCKENLELVTKYDSSPACVKPATKQKLIERGWTSSFDGIKKILNDNDCVEFGRWLNKHADGNYNQNLLIFDLPVPYDLSQRIYESIPDCIGDQSGFFDLNTKHIMKTK